MSLRQRDIEKTTVSRIRGLIFRDLGPDPVLLIGAGGSVKSGIPLSGHLAGLAARWAYCREQGLPEDDLSVQRSDWITWLRRFDWFDAETALESQYPQLVERLLRPREERREFLLGVTRVRGVPLSPGLSALADLVGKNWIRTLLTPNFDLLIPQALQANSSIRHCDVIRTPSDAYLISTSGSYPQVVFLHGSVEHYSDQNIEEETQRLNSDLRARLYPIIRDHPLIVIGYRGAEPSVVNDLLGSLAQETLAFKHGLFWCCLEGHENDLHPLVIGLASKVGSNFQLVPIAGFDECMIELARDAERKILLQTSLSSKSRVKVRDAQPSSATLESLDWNLISEVLPAYAARTAIPVPASPSRDWLLERLLELDLAIRQSSQSMATNAGELLFANDGPLSIVVEDADATREFRGNIFNLIDTLTEVFAEVNQPFRLKGARSEVVTPFPLLALKELLANTLAHRDYENPNSIRVEVSDKEIRFENPGGLFGGIEPEALGTPGVRAYRNPVIADLLYGTGAMDKAGSGLADVARWAREIGAQASFGPVGDNTRFVASITSRPERPDPETRTADPARLEIFSTNILPVNITSGVYVATTRARHPNDIYAGHRGERVPPFYIHGGRLLSLSDLRDSTNPLSDEVEGDLEVLTVEDFFGNADLERLLIRLLNSSMFYHAGDLGLLRVYDDQRLYFPRTDEGSREITYQARVRKATRTVTKPIVSRTTGEVRYWEHEAVRFRFRRFGSELGLLLLPGYVFTRDGQLDRLRGPKVSRLATRRAARDYNAQVANDVVFWGWVLTSGEDRSALQDGVHSVELLRKPLGIEIRGAPAVIAFDDAEDGFDDQAVDEELAALAETPELNGES